MHQRRQGTALHKSLYSSYAVSAAATLARIADCICAVLIRIGMRINRQYHHEHRGEYARYPCK